MNLMIRKYLDTDFLEVFKILKDNFLVEKSKDCCKDDVLEFVAVDNEKVVGYFILRRVLDIVKNNKYFYLEYVCVDKQQQNKGIGKKIMEFVVDFCKNEKASYIELTSSYTREAAHHLYSKYGFLKRESYIFRREL